MGGTNHGGHADRIAVHETACVLMPEGLSYEEGKVPLKRLVTHRFPLEKAEEAYKIFESGQTGKVVITWA